MLKGLLEVKELNRVNKAFFFGMLFMTIGTVFYTLESVIDLNIPVIRYLLMSFSAFFFIKYIYYSKKRINILTAAFIIWTITIILFSFNEIIIGANNYRFLKRLMSGEILLYIIPLISLCEIDINFVKKIFQFSFFLTLLGCLFVPFADFIYQNAMLKEDSSYSYENISRIFTASGSIILLTFPYHKKKINLIVIISIFISLLIFLLTARRNMIVYYLGVTFFAFYILLTTKKIRKLHKYILIINMIIFLSLLTFLFFSYIEYFYYAITRFNSGFESRDFIIEEFFYDFNSSPSDWYTGRGIFGSFKTNVLITDESLGTRDGIENGYLTYILKGGYIYLGIVVLISVAAIYNGLIKSKNTISKSFSFIIIIYYIDMVGFGIPENHMKFLIIWVAIAACFSKKIIMMDEKQLIKKIGLC